MKFSLTLFSLMQILAFGSTQAAEEDRASAAAPRPWMLVTADRIDGLRSLEDVRRDIRSGRSAVLWKQLVDKVDQEMQKPPITAGKRNRNYTLVALTGNRIMDTALVALIKNERRYAVSVLEQIEVLFDKTHWPDWSDEAHLQAGLNSDLRHGQLARAIGLAYDWTWNLLTAEERKRIVAGVDVHAIPRFKASVKAKEKWITAQSNWKTSVVGGFGILGMALGPDHPESQWLQEFAQPLMDRYMDVFGPDGEFNESPNYASSTMYVVDYYLAKYYSSGGRQKPAQLDQLGKFAHWYLHCILPSSRVIAFGDGRANSPPSVYHFSALASALQDPIIQWMYMKYVQNERDDTRRRAHELLWFDPTLNPEPPDRRLPLGRSYPAQAGIVVSRSSWNTNKAVSTVYSKALTEDSHRHADWGQVCVDGFQQRLLVDLGSPPVYPRSDKRQYYNYQQSGHNVLAFGDDELDVNWRVRRQGKTIWSKFDNARGGAWSFDLSEAYGKNRTVRRHVVHLLPRIVVVLDDAALPSSERIRLRWHTISPPKVDAEGRFTTGQNGVTLAGLVTSLSGNAEIRTGRHEYLPPYNKGRLGKPYPQRHEPFVEMEAQSDRFRSVSLFCVTGPEEYVRMWQHRQQSWEIEPPEGAVRVTADRNELTVTDVKTGSSWSVDLQR